MPSQGSLWQSSFISQSNLVLDHPLRLESRSQSNVILNGKNLVDNQPNEDDIDFADPLNVHSTPNQQSIPSNANAKLSNIIVDGPLSNTLAENSTFDPNDYDPELIGFKPWFEYRSQIQAMFHTKDLLSLETSFIKTSTTKHVRKKRTNDEPLSIGVLHELTEEDYNRRFKELTRILHQFWLEERRLECIKLCREVSAVLSSSQSPRFYPQKFVLVTDFLETFGRLVYERLYRKANEERAKNGLDPLSSNFETAEILEKTRITARNWFGKLSEIRDVVQRIYIGTCLMPCLKFMDESAAFGSSVLKSCENDNIMRLCVLACSLQHPLTSSYARCYICRISMRLMPLNRGPHWKCLNDWLQNGAVILPTLILWPALDFIVQCVSYGAVIYNDLLPLWEYCKVPEKRPFMLKSVFNGLPPLYLAEHSLAACKLLTSSEHVNCEEICAFGENLLRTTVFEQNRRFILKSVWKHIKAMPSLKSFLLCCEVWIEFAAKYFSISHVHFMLETIVERLTPDRKFEQNVPILISMIRRVVRSVKDVAELIDPEVFLRFSQMITEKESAREMSVVVLNGLVVKHALSSLNNITLAYQILDLCKCIHSVITINSEQHAINDSIQLICGTLDRFELKAVPEQGLSFFVAARAALLNLDECQKYVIARILELGLYVVRSARFSSARSAFVQACVANAYITVPSLPDPCLRIQMFIQSAELALAGMAFLQVDSFVEACLREFQTFPKGKQQQFYMLLSEFMAFLLTVPIFEDTNCISIYEALLECVKNYEWSSLTCVEHQEALLSCLRFLYTLQDLNSNPSSQFLWTVGSGLQTKLNMDSLFNALLEQITAVVHEESDKRPLMSVAFLENLASFSGQIDQSARPVAKIAYKKCKNAEQSIVDRMTAINFN